MDNVPTTDPYQRVIQARSRCFPLTPDNLTVSTDFAHELRMATVQIAHQVIGPHEPRADCDCDLCKPGSAFPYMPEVPRDHDPYLMQVTGLPARIVPGQTEDFILRLGSTAV